MFWSRPHSPCCCPARPASCTQAERAFRSVLERYPKSPKVHRAFAAFLEEIRNNPWSARRYLDEAAKLEAEEEAAREDDGAARVNERVDAVAVISAAGVIKVVNTRLLRLFGCAFFA